MVGHLSLRDSMKGTLGRAPLVGNPRDEVFDGHAKCTVGGPPSSWGPCWGTLRGFICWDF